MGAQISSSSKLTENEFLRRLSGLEPISDNDPFWNQLFSFNFRPPTNRIDGRFFEESVIDLLEALMYNSPTTGNFVSLVRVFLRRATELKTSAQCEDKIFLWQTSNALLVLRCICKFFAQRLNPDEFRKMFVKSPSNQADNADSMIEEISDSPVDEFLGSLIEILVDLPVSDITLKMHFEALNCLLCVLTCELFNQQTTPSKFLNILMQGKCSIHAPVLTKTLLNNYVTLDTDQAKNSFDGGGSVILGLAATFANVLQWGYNSGGGGVELDKDEMNQTLSNQSLLALLILSCHSAAAADNGYNNKKQVPPANPYRQALFAFHNSQEVSTLTSPTSSVATFKFDYSRLYEKLCVKAGQEPSLLLLYLLIHKNAGFRNYVLSRVNIENLLFPLLKVLNVNEKLSSPDDSSLSLSAVSSSSRDVERIKTSCDLHHIYLALIILLMLSEDDFFCKVVHETIVKGINWCTNRILNDLTLGGLIILILLKTIQHNVAKVKDRYLQTNCLATLANMSANFKQLHPHICQQLVGLLEILCKRHSRLIEQIGLSPEYDYLAKQGANVEHVQTITAIEEGMRMLMEILNSALTNNLRNNPHLIYTMLYKRELFDSFQNHPMFQDLLWNIGAILNHFASRVNSLDDGANVNEVLEVIQRGALQWPTDRLKRFPELKFKYVEDANTEEFFVPYAWSLVVKYAGLYWEPSKIKLFEAKVIKRTVIND